MKKLLLAVAVLFSVQLGAQNIEKEQAKAQSSVEKAKAATMDEKKAAKPATWIKLSDTYMKAYNMPKKDVYTGISYDEVRMYLTQEVLGQEQVVLEGKPYVVETYSDKQIYFDQNGMVSAILVTKPRLEGDILGMAADALRKAKELSEPGSSNEKKVDGKINVVALNYFNDALAYNLIGDYKKATYGLGQSADLYELAGRVDTVAIYYTGITASAAGDNDRAVKYFGKCLDLGYDLNGDLYSFVADAYRAMEDYDNCKKVLSAGFAKYPTNQGILVSLINAYLDSNDDPKKVLEFIHMAQANEPGNPTLFYAEGNVWRGLNEYDKAIECYEKSLSIDPDFVYGYFSIGDLLYSQALELQDKASLEMDDTKYRAMMDEFDSILKNAIVPFEKAYTVTDDAEIQVVIAEFLKNIYFRFRDKGEEYQQAYDKYNAIVENGK